MQIVLKFRILLFLFSQDDSGLVENVSKKGHNFVIESLHKIAKLSAELDSVEAEISQLQKNYADYDGDEMIVPDSFESHHPSPSPPISSRNRRTVRPVEETTNAASSPNRR